MGFLACVFAALFASSKDLYSKKISLRVSGLHSAFASFIFALPFYLAIGGWVFYQRRKSLGLKVTTLLKTVALGILGYYIASYADLYGLQFVSTQLGRMILFTYPTIVTLLGWWGVTQAWPVLLMQNVSDTWTLPYLWVSRLLLVLLLVVGFLMVRKAWSNRGAQPTAGRSSQ